MIDLQNIPKVELHVHLEGAIPLPALRELVIKYSGKHSKDLQTVEQKFRYRDFSHFIRTWSWIGTFIREYEDYRFIAESVAKNLKAQNILYAEILYSPSRDSAKHLQPQKITEAVLDGFGHHATCITLRLIADMIRDNGPNEAMMLLNQLREVKDMGIMGIGMGGSEQLHPLDPYKEVFQTARAYGFHTTVHAGESGRVEHIWQALNLLQVDRIAHALMAGENERLMEVLKKKQIPLEMCPTSNVKTGVIEKIQDHPIRAYYQQGLNVCINTDDPALFQTSLADEYQTLISELDFKLIDIKTLIENAIHSAWCTHAEKHTLQQTLDQFWQRSQSPHTH